MPSTNGNGRRHQTAGFAPGLVPGLVLGLVAGLVAGLVVGVLLYAWLDATPAMAPGVDPRDTGLSIAWLVLGFSAQAIFAARMLLQWISSERRGASVVPVAFWWLSLFGALMLLVYFLRRGDPVGVVGQTFGIVVYVRNLVLIERDAAQGRAQTSVSPTAGAGEPAAPLRHP